MPSTESTDKGPDEMFCSSCGELIKRDVAFCPECGTRHQQPPHRSGEKVPEIAAILSFVIVGLGQVYNGQIVKGVVFHIGMWFAFIVGVLFFWLFFPLFIPLGLWLFNIYDAYDQAQKINLRQ